MLACEESASIVCARVMRGTSSTARAVTPRAASAWLSSGRSSGRRYEIRSGVGGQRGDLVVGGRRDTQHDVGACQCGGGVGDELGAVQRIALVGVSGCNAGAALEAHARTRLAQALDLVGRERDPSLAVCPLAADGDEHAGCGGLLGRLRHAGESGSMWG